MQRQISRVSLLYLALLLCSTIGCTSNRQALNEENSFYKRGMQLQQDGNYEDAIAAFQQCLQHSPESYKANLQLALMYEDHKQDYPQAIVHYTTYLKNSTDTDNIKIAQQWHSRAERKYYEMLRLLYSEAIVEPTTHPMSRGSTNSFGFSRNYVNGQRQDKKAIKTASAAPAENILDPSDFNPRILSASSYSRSNAEINSHYIVQEGDTLVHIAEELFGSQQYWQDLYEYNKDILPSPERLQIGQKLKIPSIAPRK